MQSSSQRFGWNLSKISILTQQMYASWVGIRKGNYRGNFR